MSELIDQAWAVADRLYTRLGTQSARGLDVDTCVVITEMAVELDRRDDRPLRRTSAGYD